MAPTIDRWTRNEIVRYEFGTDAAFHLALRADSTVQTAIGLATHAASARDLVLHPATLPDTRGPVADRADARAPTH